MTTEDAIKKIDDEAKKYGLNGVMSDWNDLLVEMVTANETIRDAVESHCFATEVVGKLLKDAFKNKVEVHKDIVKAAGLKAPVYLGIPSRADVKKCIKEVYQ